MRCAMRAARPAGVSANTINGRARALAAYDGRSVLLEPHLAFPVCEDAFDHEPSRGERALASLRSRSCASGRAALEAPLLSPPPARGSPPRRPRTPHAPHASAPSPRRAATRSRSRPGARSSAVSVSPGARPSTRWSGSPEASSCRRTSRSCRCAHPPGGAGRNVGDTRARIVGFFSEQHRCSQSRTRSCSRSAAA